MWNYVDPTQIKVILRGPPLSYNKIYRGPTPISLIISTYYSSKDGVQPPPPKIIKPPTPTYTRNI